MKLNKVFSTVLGLSFLALLLTALPGSVQGKEIKLLNVSYDPTRELYQEFNFLAVKEFGADKVEIVAPSISILAEPPVTVVDKVARKHGTEAAAKAYLEYLYSEEGQEIAGRNFYRPRSEKAAAKHANTFARVELFTIDEVFGGWQSAQKAHFNDGGVFDQIYQPNR